MSSKIAIFIAIFLFFLSWCVPAVDGMVGFGVMVTSILYHFLIVPIPKVFPVWANLTFLLAVGCYFKESEMLETFESKAWMYGIVTCVLMCTYVYLCVLMCTYVYLCVLDFLQQLLKLMWVL